MKCKQTFQSIQFDLVYQTPLIIHYLELCEKSWSARCLKIRKSLIFILSGQKLIKNASVTTYQINFNCTKIGGKPHMRHLVDFQTLCLKCLADLWMSQSVRKVIWSERVVTSRKYFSCSLFVFETNYIFFLSFVIKIRYFFCPTLDRQLCQRIWKKRVSKDIPCNDVKQMM